MLKILKLIADSIAIVYGCVIVILFILGNPLHTFGNLTIPIYSLIALGIPILLYTTIADIREDTTPDYDPGDDWEQENLN